MEATLSSETSVFTRPTLRHVKGDGILHNYRRENLKSYKRLIVTLRPTWSQNSLSAERCQASYTKVSMRHDCT
jgi:hypothetical protein